jgi:hypothetical protein
MSDDNMNLGERDDLLGMLAALREWMVQSNRAGLLKEPAFAEALNQKVREMAGLVEEAEQGLTGPVDGGLLDLVGLGAGGIRSIRDARYATTVPAYDDQVARERVTAIADLYYIYQHERMGVFRAVLKLQQLFKAGVVRLSEGDGATRLYQYDRKQALRYTMGDRRAAYRKVLGYTDASPPDGASANTPFHKLFMNFNRQTSNFFQDKRVSEVIRPDGRSETFGSMAVVRRAGLDLRHNLKQVSYGHVAVLRTEVMSLLEAAFDILEADDIKNLFGAANGWETLEEILKRHLSEMPLTSQRSRMAIAGRKILRWLAEPYLLSDVRIDFETYLEDIVDDADDWLTSAESLGLQKPAQPAGFANVVPLRARSRR